MRAVDVIRAKRDGRKLDREAVTGFVEGVTSGEWPDYQVSALLMAITLRGMDQEETCWLAEAMADSGRRLDLRGLPGPKVDKHSTGGVGDKASIVVAPLAASCGVIVPMISGRGLGHTGGTLDKLEAIPRFSVHLAPAETIAILSACGCAIVGQSDDIVPADRLLYALRDVTATVESLPLITASIMSKKMAEGLDGLVLDVKTGSGAVATDLEASRALARSLLEAGSKAGLRSRALITDMDAPLGSAVGNAVEIVESIETLKGRGPDDLERLSVRLAAEMIVVAGIAPSLTAAERLARDRLASGAALDRLRRMICGQGGDGRVVDDYGLLPLASGRQVVCAPSDGYVSRLDAGLIGRAAVLLGAGRSRSGDRVDHGVGIMVRAKPGDRVRAGEAVLEILHRDGFGIDAAVPMAVAALEVAEAPPPARPLVFDAFDGCARCQT
ncbi:MAG: thymidine phosphorylase [Acidobacteria bacterium]|nr:MAG: thymidine phosphorylase [Acidobacteriota bacterium]RPJ84295.1 MAG: thymidine phosphorylase [Acidobacteriota bacterium]